MTSFADNGPVTNLFCTKKASSWPLLSFRTNRQSTEVVFLLMCPCGLHSLLLASPHGVQQQRWVHQTSLHEQPPAQTAGRCSRQTVMASIPGTEKLRNSVSTQHNTRTTNSCNQMLTCHSLDHICCNLQWFNNHLVRQHSRRGHSTGPHVVDSESCP